MASGTPVSSQDDVFPPVERVRFCKDCLRWYFFPSAHSALFLCPQWPCHGKLAQPDSGTYAFFQRLWEETRRDLDGWFTMDEVREVARLRWLKETQALHTGGQQPGYRLSGRAVGGRPSLLSRVRRALWGI